MSNWMILGVVVVVALGWILMPKGASGYEVKALSSAEMRQMGALVVDIRRPEEWAQTGVIQGAKRLTFTDPASFIAALGAELTPDRPLVLVCQSGRRSAAAAGALTGKVANKVISQAGGMGAWIAARSPVVK